MGGQGARAGGIQPHQAAAHARLGQVEGQHEIAEVRILGHQRNMAIKVRFSTDEPELKLLSMGGLEPPIQNNRHRRWRLWMAGSSPAMVSVG
jgi:hypothetical protein